MDRGVFGDAPLTTWGGRKVTVLSPRPVPALVGLSWLDRLTARFGPDNVEVRPGDGDWADYLMVYVRASPVMPWRFSGNAYRPEGETGG